MQRKNFGLWFALVILAPILSVKALGAENEPPLIAATKAGDGKRVERLLSAGTDPDAADSRNNTALIFAARDGQLVIVRTLIQHGATVNWIDGEGVTPLILAAYRNHLDIAQLLLEHGADTSIRDQWDRNAADYARRRGESDPILRLLESYP